LPLAFRTGRASPANRNLRDALDISRTLKSMHKRIGIAIKIVSKKMKRYLVMRKLKSRHDRSRLIDNFNIANQTCFNVRLSKKN
jgi:hypothetical protein